MRTTIGNLVAISTLLTASFASQPTEDRAAMRTGRVPYTAFGGVRENINLSNGNLNLNIPLLTLPGRAGHDLNLALIYDSKMWNMEGSYEDPYGADDAGYITWSWHQEDAGYKVGARGWRINIPFLYSGYLQQGVDNCRYLYVAILPDGSKHSFPNRSPLPTYQGSCGPSVTDSQDGAFMRLDTSLPTEAILYMKDGTRVHFPGHFGLASKVVDANGNKITYTQLSNGDIQITDTVGRVVTVTMGTVGSASTATSISYKNSAGNTKTIAFGFQIWPPDGSSGTMSYPRPNSTFSKVYPQIEVIQPTTSGQNLTTITLPESLGSYQFEYNEFAEITRIQYPTGGETKYGYTGKTFAVTGETLPMYFYCHFVSMQTYSGIADFRQVLRRAVRANSQSAYDITTYTPVSIVGTDVRDRCSNGVEDGNNRAMEVRHLGPSQQIDRTHYEFTSLGFPPNASGQENKRQIYQGESTLLRTIDTTYTPYASDGAQDYPLPKQITTTLDNGLQSKVTYTYDTHTATTVCQGCFLSPLPAFTVNRFLDNVLTMAEYDYGFNLIRTTTNTWLKTNPANSLSYIWGTTDNGGNVRILDRKLTEIITNSASAPVSNTSYEYDNYGSLGGRPSSGATQLDGRAYSANTTKIERWRNTDNAWLPTLNQYDDAGNVIKTRDPGGHETSFDFTDNWANATCQPASPAKAYVKRVINAKGHITLYSYNSCTGTLASITDPNLQPTSYTYDPMDRLATTTLPDGGGSTRTYNDAIPFVVTSRTKQDTNPVNDVVNETQIDGIGRVVQTRLTSDPQGTVYTDTTYDALGRVYTVSNPYRIGDTIYNTTTQYDALGRVTYVTKQDGSYTADYYSGNTDTHYDEAGRGRIFYNDGVGRLYHVVEPKPDNTSWAYNTWYAYDALDNLLSVNQVGDGTGTARNRTFTYNSLSQLLTANNPESGTICYGIWSGTQCINGYDNDGNLLKKTDARNLTVNYLYDELHRLRFRTYSDQSISEERRYDLSSYAGVSLLNPIGRLSATLRGNTSYWFSYDSMGRILNQWNAPPSAYGWTSYPTQAYYNLAGAMDWLIYPSGRKITNSYDPAGRLNKVSFASFNGTIVNYPYYTPTSFLPSGVASNVTLGNGTTEIAALNNRLQPCQYKLLSTSNTSLIDRRTFYTSATGTICPTSTSGNNGNVLSVADNVAANKSQTFTYDYLNRITAAAETSGFSQTFSYDAWGNMNQAGSLAFSVPFNTKNQVYDSVHPSWYVHDTAGNMTTSSNGVSTQNYAYDAESQISSSVSGTTTTNYTYDANGQRVRKQTGSNYTEYIYFGGEPIAEKDQAGTWTDYIFAGGKRIVKATGSTFAGSEYYHGDHLGTARMMTDANGAVTWSGTFLPFGWEYNAQASTNHYKFTGKERDSESGLDYFGARYYSSNMGRWLSPDWSATPEPVPYSDLNNPQSLNLYAYVLNSPTSRIDASGHAPKGKDDACKNDPDHCVTVTATPPPGPERILFALSWGHHGLPGWGKIQRGTEAFRFFRNWNTGRLLDATANYFDWPHRMYSAAVAQQVEAFLERTGVSRIEQLTTKQCQELARTILNSKAPEISQFLQRLEATNAGALATLRGIASGSTEISVPVLMPAIQVNMILCGSAFGCGKREIY